jgi:hypothetical protein
MIKDINLHGKAARATGVRFKVVRGRFWSDSPFWGADG